MSVVITERFELARPFSFATTFRKPSHFPSPIESFPDDLSYYVAAHVGRELVGITARSVSPNMVDLAVYAPTRRRGVDGKGIVNEIARRFGFHVDVSGVRGLWTADRQLSSLAPELAGGRPAMPHSLYDFLMICVFLQNTQIRRTVQMMNAMIDRFSKPLAFPDGVILPALWTPRDVLTSSEEELRALKLGYRARTIWRLSEQFEADGDIEARLLEVEQDPPELRRRLSFLYGVGPATAGYLSFEWFKNTDDLVHLSPWETKILSQLMFEREASPSEVIAEARARWSPYTMFALHALFESVFWKRADGVGPAWLDELIRL